MFPFFSQRFWSLKLSGCFCVHLFMFDRFGASSEKHEIVFEVGQLSWASWESAYGSSLYHPAVVKRSSFGVTPLSLCSHMTFWITHLTMAQCDTIKAREALWTAGLESSWLSLLTRLAEEDYRHSLPGLPCTQWAALVFGDRSFQAGGQAGLYAANCLPLPGTGYPAELLLAAAD